MIYDNDIEIIYDELKEKFVEIKSVLGDVSMDIWSKSGFRELLSPIRAFKGLSLFLPYSFKYLISPVEYAIWLIGKKLIQPDEILTDFIRERITEIEKRLNSFKSMPKPVPAPDPIINRLMELCTTKETVTLFEKRPVYDENGSDTMLSAPLIIFKSRPPQHDHIYHVTLTPENFTLGKTVISVIRQLIGTGEVIYGEMSPSDIPEEPPIKLSILYSTILEPEYAALTTGQTSDHFHPVAMPETEEKSLYDEGFEFKVSPKLIEQFAVDGAEALERVEQLLLDIMENPDGADGNIYDAFREIHSIKGNAGFVGFADFERISHHLENLLEKIKDKIPDETCINMIMEVVDTLKVGIMRLMNTGNNKISETNSIIAKLTDIICNMADESTYGIQMDTSDIPVIDLGDEPEAAASPSPAASVTMASDSAEKQDARDKSRELKAIRVGLDKLDQLVNLVGELVIAESMVTNNSDLKGLELTNFEKAAHNLKRIISDLQDVTMSVRMIPINQTFLKMKRLSHDLSRKNGKKIHFKMVGEDTEVDKTVIEKIADPLLHIIRNAVDHGIEYPDERLKKGKPETGNITLMAGHEGGEVVIRIIDDGRGIDKEKVLKKAIAKGVIKGDAEDLSDGDISRLIFEPGFSTADKVSDVSGRGVGMDVVHRNLERLNGRITVTSTAEKGLHITLYIPLTLAIMDGMVVRVGKIRYTLPLLTICESFLALKKNITITPDTSETIRLRDEMLPIVRLYEVFGVLPDNTDLEKGILILVQSGRDRICLFVDEILGQQQTVIKALPAYLKNAEGLSGCTILGDGDVSLIIDVARLFDKISRKNLT